jgi:hypothetical protein
MKGREGRERVSRVHDRAENLAGELELGAGEPLHAWRRISLSKRNPITGHARARRLVAGSAMIGDVGGAPFRRSALKSLKKPPIGLAYPSLTPDRGFEPVCEPAHKHVGDMQTKRTAAVSISNARPSRRRRRSRAIGQATGEGGKNEVCAPPAFCTRNFPFKPFGAEFFALRRTRSAAVIRVMLSIHSMSYSTEWFGDRSAL